MDKSTFIYLDPKTKHEFAQCSEKICTKCFVSKSLNEYHKHKYGKLGLNPVCKKCRLTVRHTNYINNKSYYAKQTMIYQKNNPEKRHGYRLVAKYGITTEIYNKMLEEQDYKCKICKTVNSGSSNKRKLSVDHNHSTGKVRGLLCDNCNKSLGLLKDSIDTLKNMIDYLQNG